MFVVRSPSHPSAQTSPRDRGGRDARRGDAPLPPPPRSPPQIGAAAQADLLNALFEGHLLRTLGGDGVDGNLSERTVVDGVPDFASLVRGKLPSLVACDSQQLSADQWRIRLAMTRIDGEPLDNFFARCRESMLPASSSRAWPSREFRKAPHVRSPAGSSDGGGGLRIDGRSLLIRQAGGAGALRAQAAREALASQPAYGGDLMQSNGSG